MKDENSVRLSLMKTENSVKLSLMKTDNSVKLSLMKTENPVWSIQLNIYKLCVSWISSIA